MINLSLAQRIRYSLVLVSTVSALLFSVIAHLFIEEFEASTLKVHLRNDLTHYIQQYQNQHDLVRVQMIDAYFVKYPIGHNDGVDEELKHLKAGEYELERPYGEDMVFVKDIKNERYILVSKQEHFEQLEMVSSMTLIIATLSLLILSLFISTLLSKRILKPITNLSLLLKNKHDNQLDHQPIDMHNQKDEVGFLINSFNQYLNKITEILKREQLFTSDISHELRTPLMIIKSSLELLEHQKNPNKQAELLIKINSSVSEIQELIDTFTFLAREKNQYQSNTLTDKVDSILKRRLEYWKEYAAGQNIQLQPHIEQDITFECSAPLFSTVLNNLIKNALLHSHSKQVDIYLTNQQVRVIDHGDEITTELQKVFFDAYQKGDSNSSGLGLGLSIIKRICEHQNWVIRYEYEAQQGSAFIVKFN